MADFPLECRLLQPSPSAGALAISSQRSFDERWLAGGDSRSSFCPGQLLENSTLDGMPINHGKLLPSCELSASKMNPPPLAMHPHQQFCFLVAFLKCIWVHQVPAAAYVLTKNSLRSGLLLIAWISRHGQKKSEAECTCRDCNML